jgi:2-polyprenyl-3-methyl-5-hydroxy-6-metoxy-1,4-benzoquinol methylase
METKEQQNQPQIDDYRNKGAVTFGPWTSHIWRSDPRHLGFLLARYKFCAKMLTGKSRVLEIGCGDGAGVAVVLQSVESVYAIDFEPLVLEDASQRFKKEGITRCEFAVHDITERPLPESGFDGAYSLDVIEHIPPQSEARYLDNICRSLKSDAIMIIGTPNISSQEHASPESREGHINLKSAETLRASLGCRFDNVFIFSMNDEVVHTGYAPMAHYLLGMGVGLRSS